MCGILLFLNVHLRKIPFKMNKTTLLLIFFIVFWLIDLGMIYTNNRAFLIVPRVLSLLSLGLYYVFSTKKVSISFWILLFFILLTGALFSLNDYTLIGMLSLIALRFSWVNVLLSYKEKIDKKLVLLVFLLSTTVFSIILSILYVDTVFFYLSIITSLALLSLLAISFSKLITDGLGHGNKEMLISVAIFIISDTLSGSKKIEGTTTFFLMLSVFLYNIAYFFLMKSLIKKDAKFELVE
jgi:hypothetical protein